MLWQQMNKNCDLNDYSEHCKYRYTNFAIITTKLF